MLTTYHDDRTDTVIEWNGSATFNVQVDGVDVDCFTVYGAPYMGSDGKRLVICNGNPCTPQEAYEAAQAHFAQMETEEEDQSPEPIDGQSQSVPGDDTWEGDQTA